MAVADEAKKASPATLNEIANNVFNEIYTSLDLSEIVELLGNYRVRQSCKADGYEIRDVHIQIHIQHTDCHFRPAFCICCVAFIIRIVAQIQIRITIHLI